MSIAFSAARSLGRVLILVLLVAAGTILLMRFAPGYFSDVREMDPKYGQQARSELNAQQAQHGTLRAITVTILGGWLHGDLGRSRQYDISVQDLILPRLGITASLLVRGIGCGWGITLLIALPVSASKRWRGLFGVPFTLLLAVPTGALATVCLLANQGGPVVVLILVLAARDYKFLDRALRAAWDAPHLLSARAQGLRRHRLALVHIIPNILPQMIALATLSLVTALSAIVPIEVIFDVPGLGQLAWTAAMNRDLPVLMATTMVMAAAVAIAGMFSSRARLVAFA